jgi:hypothetical protein
MRACQIKYVIQMDKKLFFQIEGISIDPLPETLKNSLTSVQIAKEKSS